MRRTGGTRIACHAPYPQRTATHETTEIATIRAEDGCPTPATTSARCSAWPSSDHVNS